PVITVPRLYCHFVIFLAVFLTVSSFRLFFYCIGHHRDLHSFPTRRSSDLYKIVKCQVYFLLIFPFLLSYGLFSYKRMRVVRFQTDRKSTRLNSSHVSISYAVFCLKKKIDQAKPLSTKSYPYDDNNSPLPTK